MSAERLQPQSEETTDPLLEPNSQPQFVLLDDGLYGSSPGYAQQMPEYSEEFRNYARHIKASGDVWRYLKLVLKGWFGRETSHGQSAIEEEVASPEDEQGQ